jgi:hypothetical protein
MTTGTYACLPTQQVLLAGGRISFNNLASRLMSIDPSRFRDISNVDKAIENYSPCLENKNGQIIYNKKARSYSYGSISSFEREVQAWLHLSVLNMEKWQLYPFKTPLNSKRCYMNIPWKDIPRDNHEDDLPEKYKKGQNYKCDFRCKGEDSCKLGCGISEKVLRKYATKYVGMLDEDELKERVGEKKFKELEKTLPIRWERRDNFPTNNL